MKVLKFGGTSVGSAKNIRKVVAILDSISKKDNCIVIVSAIGGITDKLLDTANRAIEKDITYQNTFLQIEKKHLNLIDDLIINKTKRTKAKNIILEKLAALKQLLDGLYLINELSPKTTDKLLSFGELMSSFIIWQVIQAKGLDIVLKNSQNLIITDNNFTKATVQVNKTEQNIQKYFKNSNSKITIVPGFVSKSVDGEFTTLGRGGSDYTAAIIAAALEVDELQIWTDVSGMYTTNPKLVKQAKPIKNISYQEAVELSHFGAKVLYPPTVQPVLDKNIPILIKNTLAPDDFGTFISADYSNGQDLAIKGISNIDKIALLTLQGNGMVGIPGFSKRLFETLLQHKINVILITQASSEHSICIGISEKDADIAKVAIDQTFNNEISLHKIDPLIIEKELAIIAVVGDNMKNHQGISGKMFSTLGKNNINIRAIAQGASERNISAVIAKKDIKKALNTIHECFFEEPSKQLNLFITGVGNVGEKLLDQINQQQEYLKKNLKIDLQVVGISNSRKMFFNKKGVNLNKWVTEFNFAEKSSIQGFYEKAISMNLRNSVFLDITANKEVTDIYTNYLKHNIAVVACNKIACSGPYNAYLALQRLSLKYNSPFLYETNVGAGLPIINTLNNLIASGDKVINISAVLSGSLNFIFNNFNETKNFHDVVKQAQFEGYTEPDPRIDLSGIDVARKILILSRENGLNMEIEDVENKSFLTEANLKADSVEDFYESLIKDEAHFQNLFASAKANKCQLKYVAEYKNGKAQVGLKEIATNHPFYNLKGKDNIVMFYTERYPKQPLIIKGAGAGAGVTASGLFAEIIKIAKT